MQDIHEIASQAIPAAKMFDARAFVFACLQENPALKLAEIEQLALAQYQELSQATASRYRKQFFAKHESSAPQALPIEEQRVVGEEPPSVTVEPHRNKKRVIGAAGERGEHDATR